MFLECVAGGGGGDGEWGLGWVGCGEIIIMFNFFEIFWATQKMWLVSTLRYV